MPDRPAKPAMPLYAFTIFLSAFLLFLVQPVIAKQILPWFGGSAAVWTTCLVFFQMRAARRLRLLGLDHAPRSRRAGRRGCTSRCSWRASLLLPIIPDAHWKPAGGENPTWLILGLLGATIGLPYFLLSTTSPLVQAWFARRFPARSPYRLFALSNLASLLALIGYPFADRAVDADRARSRWSGRSAYRAVRRCCAPRPRWRALGALPPARRARSPPRRMRGRAARLRVARLAALARALGDGLVLLLAVTNHLTQNVASMPLLWVAAARRSTCSPSSCASTAALVPARRLPGAAAAVAAAGDGVVPADDRSL